MRAHKSILTTAFFLFLFMLALPQERHAEYYKYVTEEGHVFYVDDITNIPEQYRDDIKTYKEQVYAAATPKGPNFKPIKNAITVKKDLTILHRNQRSALPTET